MTAEELEKSVAIELFRTDDPEGYQQYDAGILVSFPDVYKELARMAIRVCMEAAIIVPSNRANEANVIGDQKTMSQMHIIMDELYKLIPESQS